MKDNRTVHLIGCNPLRNWLYRFRQACILSIFVIFSIFIVWPESVRAAMIKPTKAVFMFDAKNIIVDYSAIKPDRTLPPYNVYSPIIHTGGIVIEEGKFQKFLQIILINDTMNNSTFQLAGSSLTSLHSKPADNNKAVGEINESKIGYFNVAAHPFIQRICIITLGLIFILFGVIIIRCSLNIPFYASGVIFVCFGIVLALYGQIFLPMWFWRTE